MSMLMVALLMRAWVEIMKTKAVFPSLLVDDIMIIAYGKNMLRDIKAATDATHEYLIDMGGKISATKSYTFASTKKARYRLKGHRWKHLGKTVQVAPHFKYLGGQI